MSDSQHADLSKSTAGKVLRTTGEQPAEPVSAQNEHPLLNLQRMIGNRALTKMLGVQAKLTVGAADDAYEQEADSTAQQVMAMRDPAAVGTVQRAEGDEVEDEEISAKRLDIVQRAEGDEVEDEEISAKRLDIVQRAEGDEVEDEEISAKRESVDMMGSFDVGGDLEDRIQNQSGGGQALDDGVRGFMEPRFGADFSGVRVHADSESGALNSAIQAKAFTKGSDIFFNEGQYQPDTDEGKSLLAHELTHVIQQGGGK